MCVSVCAQVWVLCVVNSIYIPVSEAVKYTCSTYCILLLLRMYDDDNTCRFCCRIWTQCFNICTLFHGLRNKSSTVIVGYELATSYCCGCGWGGKEIQVKGTPLQPLHKFNVPSILYIIIVQCPLRKNQNTVSDPCYIHVASAQNYS